MSSDSSDSDSSALSSDTETERVDTDRGISCGDRRSALRGVFTGVNELRYELTGETQKESAYSEVIEPTLVPTLVGYLRCWICGLSYGLDRGGSLATEETGVRRSSSIW